MKITKFGHCCLLIDVDGTRILTDPGKFSTAQDELQNITAVLITHEHFDHLHLESLKNVLKRNPKAIVLTNSGVGALLTDAGIPFQLLEEHQAKTISGVLIQGYGHDHALIYRTFPTVMNTGYRIAERFFYPGDALTVIEDPVEILALPVSAPWLTISQAIDYALAQKPKICFPVHDGILAPAAAGLALAPGRVLPDKGIRFEPLEIGRETTF